MMIDDDDDVYYWQAVLSPCFIAIFLYHVNQCMVQMKLLLLFSKLIGVTFPKMISCLMAVRNFQSYFLDNTGSSHFAICKSITKENTSL